MGNEIETTSTPVSHPDCERGERSPTGPDATNQPRRKE